MSDELDAAVRRATDRAARQREAALAAQPEAERRAREQQHAREEAETRVTDAAAAFVRRAQAARIPPDSRVRLIDGMKPGWFARRPYGWRIRSGSPKAYGGGHPSIWVLDDGRVVTGSADLRGGFNMHDGPPNRGPHDDPVELMGAYLAARGA